MRVILNGKIADSPLLREAIADVRRDHDLEVRVTWERGDFARLVGEAIEEGCERICVGGGDGSLNEALGCMVKDASGSHKMGILPLGTANDFATACGIPLDVSQALRLCAEGTSKPIDVASANGQIFLNVASLGFGAKVTVETSDLMKQLLGGSAYALESFVQATQFQSYGCEFLVRDKKFSWQLVAAGICNGRQAGGGQPLAPDAVIDDGSLDIVILLEFPISQIATVFEEFRSGISDGEFVRRFRSNRIEWTGEETIPLNLDGEGLDARRVEIHLLPRAIDLILPEACPCLSKNDSAAQSG